MWTVLKEFFLMGLLTFGGGMAMIPLFLDIALRHRWLTELEFSNLIAISQSTPGPIAINMATFIGYLEYGVWGSLAASFVLVLPSFFLAIFLSRLLQKYKDSRYFQMVLSTMKSAVLALLVYAVYILMKFSVFAEDAALYVTLPTFALGLFLTFKTKMKLIYYLPLFALIGILFL